MPTPLSPPWGTVLPELPSTGSGPPASSGFVQQAYQGKTGVPCTAGIPAHWSAIPKVRSSDSLTVGPPEGKLFQFDPPRVAVGTLTDMVSLLVSPANAGALQAPPRLLVPWHHWSSHPFSWMKSPDKLLAMHIKFRLLLAPASCIRPFTDTSI